MSTSFLSNFTKEGKWGCLAGKKCWNFPQGNAEGSHCIGGTAGLTPNASFRNMLLETVSIFEEGAAPETGPTVTSRTRPPVWQHLEDQLQAQLDVAVASRSEHRIPGCLVGSFAGRGKWGSKY